MQAFQEGLRELGYVDGQNIRIEYGYTDVALQGHHELFPRFAAELVQLEPDVLVTSVTEATPAAKNATSTWNALGPARAGQLYGIPDSVGEIGNGSPSLSHRIN